MNKYIIFVFDKYYFNVEKLAIIISFLLILFFILFTIYLVGKELKND